ncbi:hypothetical protein TIFTF001_056595, partial [Ficus carica]
MGGCFSDMKGGKQGIGGAEQRPTAMAAAIPNSSDGPNDAVEFFHRIRGQHPLFTQLELSLSAFNLLDRDITSKSDPMAVVFA